MSPSLSTLCVVKMEETSSIEEVLIGKGYIGLNSGPMCNPTLASVPKEKEAGHEKRKSQNQENIDYEIANHMTYLLNQVVTTIHIEDTIEQIVAQSHWIICPFCGQRTMTEDAMDTHLADVHQLHGYDCLVRGCATKYPLRTQLVNHLQNDHPSVVQVGCVICGKLFTRAKFFVHLVDYHNVEILEPLAMEYRKKK